MLGHHAVLHTVLAGLISNILQMVTYMRDLRGAGRGPTAFAQTESSGGVCNSIAHGVCKTLLVAVKLQVTFVTVAMLVSIVSCASLVNHN